MQLHLPALLLSRRAFNSRRPADRAVMRPGGHSLQRRCSLPRLACRAAEEQQLELEEPMGEYCLPAYVIYDNKCNPNFTVLEVEVQDYPGLMRVLAWTLNGLDLIAQNAILRTTPEGLAKNTFWISTIRGKKLSDTRAELVAERVRDFVMYCTPHAAAEGAKQYTVGPVTVSNSEHDTYTVVYVREARPTPGFLLEVASVMTGLNVQIYQGVIQGCTDCGEDVPQLVEDLNGDQGRLFKFWVQNGRGSKMEYPHISALIYALGIGLGFATFPLVPPDQEVLLGAKH